jgi:hypothetical protein
MSFLVRRCSAAQLPLGTLKLGLIANLSIFATLNDQKRNFNARFSPEAKRAIAKAMRQGEFLRVPSVRLDPFTGLAGNRQRRRHRAAVAEIDELSEKAITQPPASLQNGKRRPSLASRLASFATSVS